MALFGQPKKTELEAAAEFVIHFCEYVRDQWPALCRELQSLEPRFATLASDVIASYEFTLAVLAAQMQALPNLSSADQAARVRAHIMQCLTTDETADYGPTAIAEYETAWHKSLEAAEPPFGALASVLFDKLGLTSPVPIGKVTLKDPVLLMALGGTIVQVGGPWWKRYLETYRIVT